MLSKAELELLAEFVSKTRLSVTIDQMQTAGIALNALKEKCLLYAGDANVEQSWSAEEVKNLASIIATTSITGNLTNLPEKLKEIMALFEKVQKL